MVHSHQHLLFSTVPFSLTSHHNHPSSPSLHFLHRPSTTSTTVSAIPSAAWLSELTARDFGPLELPFSAPSSLPFTDDPSTIQVAASVLLTGAMTAFFFRTVQRRIKRAKEWVYSLFPPPILGYVCVTIHVLLFFEHTCMNRVFSKHSKYLDYKDINM